MKVVEKNEGKKIPYEVTGTKVCFDDDLTINLAKRQEDWAVHIDVLTDAYGALVVGSTTGDYYIAQIDIPAREYTDVAEKVEPVTEGGPDTEIKHTPKPLNMDDVTLTLWALENY